MEIPYTVKPRPDTGLWNAKIGIWLFLASEVMLFGGLFSGYVFLRLASGADPHYHWPEGSLEVLPGMINTFVLIASSVFVVLAWVQLKLGDWRKYTIWMSLVVICALIFMGIKAYEYNSKFTHYGIHLKDNSYVAGHYIHNDQEIKEVSKVNLDLVKGQNQFIKYVPSEERKNVKFSYKVELGASILAEEPFPAVADAGLNDLIKSDEAVINARGLLNDLLSQAQSIVVEESDFAFSGGKITAAKKKVDKTLREIHNAKMKMNRAANEVIRAHNAELAVAKKAAANAASKTDEDQQVLDSKFIDLVPVYGWYRDLGLGKLEIVPDKPFSIKVPHNRLRRATDSELEFKDYGIVYGNRTEDSRYLRVDELDLLDLRSVAEPVDAAVFRYIAEHAGDGKGEAKTEKGGAAAEGKEGGHPTSADIKEKFFKKRDEVIAKAAEAGKEPKLKDKLKMKLDHVPAKIPYEEIRMYSNYAPKQNTYYAIYFLLTGLHGLHVIAGALVLTYFLFSRKHFERDPEHLANRVEVGGLFWHFVDLVWIFLFPILYLM